MSYYLQQLEGRERARACARNDAAMENGRRIVPVHTGKVAIGIAYQPRPNRVEGDAAVIQHALLNPRTAEPGSLPRRFLGFLWEWL